MTISKLKMLIRLILVTIFSINSTISFAQTQFGPGPQVGTYVANMVRGYHFTSPVTFNICELYVPNTINSNMWHVEVVKFTAGAPPAYPGTTNSFTSLFYADSVTGTTPISCNISVNAGDVIGIYGSRSGTTGMQMTNSYDSPNFITTILGVNVTLSRSGMQFPLNNQQMHDIWSEVAFNTSRIFGFYGCCPQPPNPIGPISGPTTACIGDTLTFSVPDDTLAVTYHWSVPTSDNIIVNNDSVIQVVVGPNSTGGQICYYYTDTCMASEDTCISYTINQPNTPPSPAGIPTICLGDSSTYNIPVQAGASAYNWIVNNGAAVLSNLDSNVATVQFNTIGLTQVCVQVTDLCATSDTSCMTVNVSSGTTPSNAGFDIYNCDNIVPTLSANSPTNGIGHWEIVSSTAAVGTISNPSSPNASYSGGAPGVHTLAWIIENGTCPTSIDYVDIHIAGTPNANFTFQNECVGNSMNFVDLTSPNGTSISSWSWDFDGDGNPNSLNQNDNFTYSTPGYKTVTLIVTSLGCSDTVSQLVEAYPIPEINAVSLAACDKDAVPFNATTSISYGTVDSINFQFGDGASLWSQGNTSHIYPNAGNYSTTVTAVSNNGCVNSDVINVEVHHNPNATFVFDNSCQFQEMVFTNQSTIVGANIIQNHWDFGDGNNSTLRHPKNTYSTNGWVNVTLNVISSQGCLDDTTISVEIFPTPSSEFTFSNRVCEGEITTFNDLSSISYGTNSQFEWTIMDLYQLNGSEVQYEFPENGEYPVKLMITSDHGCKDSIEKIVPVFAVPVADFSFNDGCQNAEINFQNLSVSEDPISTYKWNFNDSSEIIEIYSPQHKFKVFGTFEVELVTTTFKGCTDKKIKTIEIGESPNPNFKLSDTFGCSPLTVSFIDSTYMYTGESHTYTWHAGQGEFSSDDSKVLLNHTGDDIYLPIVAKYVSESGCVTEILLDSFINLLPQPNAAFSYHPEEINTLDPLVQFVDESRDANYWGWYFGDGTSEKERNPVKEYTEAGEFDVVFWTRNIFDCVDTAYAKIVVKPGNRLYVPNSFSPNQDGLNDVFKIYGLETASEVKMRVFDRWGALVWVGELMDGEWDGLGANGKLVSNGTYAFLVRYMVDGEVFEYTNTLTVIGVDQ